MRLSRKNRVAAVLIALISVLFTQLAVAAYVCSGSTGSSAMSMDVETMPDCEEQDNRQSALCHAHCKDDKQSFGKDNLPVLAPLWAVGFVLVHLAPLDQHPSGTSQPAYLNHATGPPLSIRNCCFRI
jgi:hypothetical protein